MKKYLNLYLAAGITICGSTVVLGNNTDLYSKALADTNNIGNTGFYIHLEESYGKTMLHFDGVDADLEALKNSKASPRIALGYDFDFLRMELSYKDLGTLTSTDLKGEGKAKSYNFSLIHDFKNDSNFIPYVGGKLIYTKLSFDEALQQSLLDEGIESKDNNFGIGVVGGLEYKVNSNFYINSNIYFDLISSDPGYSYGAGLGVRFAF